MIMTNSAAKQYLLNASSRTTETLTVQDIDALLYGYEPAITDLELRMVLINAIDQIEAEVFDSVVTEAAVVFNRAIG